MENNNMNSTKKITVLAMVVAMATAAHWLESLLPVFIPGMPGAKLGLANVFTLFAIRKMSIKDGLFILILRCFLGTLLTGSVTGLLYSLAGGLLSWAIMATLEKLFASKISLYGISMAGALAHNVGQILMASFVLSSPYVFAYLPIMSIMALPSGFFTGLLCRLCIEAFEKAGLIT